MASQKKGSGATQPAGTGLMEAGLGAGEALAKPKLRRVSKACGPCSIAHSACDRVRPCKRCVGQGKAHQCVDVSTGRRRGRPRRQPGEAEHQLTVPKVEQDDEDSYRAGDEEDDHEAGAESAQPQTKHPQQRFVGRRRRRRESEEADDDDDDADGESEEDSDDNDNDYDVRVRHVAKRAHIDGVSETSSHHLHSFGAMRALLDEQRSLVQELRAMRSELAEVRHTQSLHEQYFASVMPLIPQSRSHSSSSVIGAGSSSPSSPPPTLRRSSHPTTNDYHPARPDVQSPTTSSSSSGSSPQPATFERCRGDNMHSFVLPTFLSLITSDALLPQPPQPQPSAVEPPSSFISAITGWEHPLSAAGGYEPMAEASYAPPPHHLHQQQQTTAAEHHHHQRRSRRHDEITPRQQRHHDPYYGSIRSHHLPARVTITGLYQKDLLIPSYAYDLVREAFNVPLGVRLEMLAHLPSLSHYNITSSAVPFAISDPRQPIAVCRAPQVRSVGQEIVTELTYVSPSFAELVQTPNEALLGTSCTSYLMCDDDEAMRQYFEEMASWVTMRSSVPYSPVLSGRILARRKDGSFVPSRVRTQMFYNDEGYFVQCVMALDVEWPAPQPPPRGHLHGRRAALPTLGYSITAAHESFGPRATIEEEADFTTSRGGATAMAFPANAC